MATALPREVRDVHAEHPEAYFSPSRSQRVSDHMVISTGAEDPHAPVARRRPRRVDPGTRLIAHLFDSAKKTGSA
jgi:hypothetical protein